MSDDTPTDIHGDAAYQQFVAEMAQQCRCSAPWPRPCDGLLAGGMCDDLGNGPDTSEREREDELE